MFPHADTLSLLWRLTRDYFRKVERPALTARLAMLPATGAPLSRSVSIWWDEHQVPFIEAETDNDLATALGIVHAHLRLAQIELMRRIARGRLSELVGRRTLAIDQLVRTFDIARAVPQIIAMMPASTVSWLEAFTRGINHAVERTRSPRELHLLGMPKQPWTVADVLAIGRLISADINWLIWMRVLPLRQRADWPELWRQFCTADLLSFAPGETVQHGLQTGTRFGSNSFAVAGWKSGSAAALIASDPHLSITLPNAWLLAGIKSPSHHAVGMMLPGIPFMGIGRNPWIAWGGTSLHAASTDLVAVPPGSPSSTREERIQVLGGQDVTQRVRESPWGPVVSDLPALFASNQTVALRWMGHQPSDEFTAMLRVGQARNWNDFREALAGYSVPGLEMVFAAASGDIGRITAVTLPNRKASVPPDILVPPDNGWEQPRTSQSLPSEFNPASGFVASANARITATPPIGYHFSPPARVERMATLLDGSAKISLQQIMAAQADVHRASALSERDAICAWLRELPETQQTADVLCALSRWDGNYDAQSHAALVHETLFVCLARDLVPDQMRTAWETSWGTRVLVWRAILDASPGNRREALSRAVSTAATNRQISWGERHRLVLSHPLAAIPAFGRRYRMFDLPVSGTSESLMKTAHGLTFDRHRATYGSVSRHVSDLADPDANHFALLGGQDGWIGSSTFADQVALWQRREYVRIPLRPETVHATFPHRTVLQPDRCE
jgi:penicillin amidase